MTYVGVDLGIGIEIFLGIYVMQITLQPFHARYNALTSSVWVDRAVTVATRVAAPSAY